MKKTALALILTSALLFSGVAGANPVCGAVVVEDSWETVAPLPKPYYYTIWGAIALNGQMYFLADGICERYDPDTNNWTAVTPPPIYNGWGAVVACQNKSYVIGGTKETPTQVYDPTTDIWENRKLPLGTTFGHQSNVVNEKIYLISGGAYAPWGQIATSAVNYVYDTVTDSWSKMASIPTPVAGYASAVVDNKIYIIGGLTATDEAIRTKTIGMVQIFDPKTNQWTTGKPIPTAVYSSGACSTSGVFAPKRIYVVGGKLRYTGGSIAPLWLGSNLNQVYDLETGIWSSAASLPENRSAVSLVNVNDTLYAVGGRNASFSATYANIQATEKYTPTGYNPSPSPTPPALDGYTAYLPIMLSVIVVIVIAAIAGIAVYHKKSKKRKR